MGGFLFRGFRSVSLRRFQVTDSLKEDFLKRIAPVSEMADCQVLTGGQLPEDLESHAWRKYNTPAAISLADSLRTLFLKRVSQFVVITDYFQFNKAAVSVTLFL
jgi:hypothetical protein